MHNEDKALGNSEPEQNVHETTTNDSDAPQQTEAKVQEHNHKLSQVQLEIKNNLVYFNPLSVITLC